MLQMPLSQEIYHMRGWTEQVPEQHRHDCEIVSDDTAYCFKRDILRAPNVAESTIVT